MIVSHWDRDALTPEQQATLRIIKRWLMIRSKPGDGQLYADIDHSDLLRRLLVGQDPMLQPDYERYKREVGS